jgi:hypothetical protein
MEIDERRLEDLVEAEVRLGIIRRMINDEDNENRGKSYSASIETKVLRQVLGMAPWEAD